MLGCVCTLCLGHVLSRTMLSQPFKMEQCQFCDCDTSLKEKDNVCSCSSFCCSSYASPTCESMWFLLPASKAGDAFSLPSLFCSSPLSCTVVERMCCTYRRSERPLFELVLTLVCDFCFFLNFSGSFFLGSLHLLPSGVSVKKQTHEKTLKF